MHLSTSWRPHMLDRRTFVSGLVVSLAGAAPVSTLLERAIRRAGGREALIRATVLRWTGTATVFASDKTVRIGVDTSVEPFRRARSDSWLLEQGPEARRSIVLEPSDAWLERCGVRMPIPDKMREHERQQFAIYGLMRLVDLDTPRVAIVPGASNLRVRHASAPETLLIFDKDATLIGAQNHVASAEDGTPILQRFRFSDHRVANGILWPRTIRIEQNGRPYFELKIASSAPAEAQRKGPARQTGRGLLHLSSVALRRS